MPAPRVLVTRSPKQASALADRLRDLGADPILIPAIQTVDPTTFSPLDTALTHLANFDWLIFTSANAVEALAARLAERKRIADQPPKPVISTETGQLHRPPERRSPHIALPPMPKGSERARIAAIGPATARALTEIGLTPGLVPPQAVAESLTEALLPHVRRPDGSPTRFLLIRAEEAREHLPETLRASGAEVTIAPAYRTVVPEGAAERIKELLATKTIDAVAFTSSSTARNLFALLESAGCTLPSTIVRASIGPITSSTLTELGHPPHLEAPQATVESLAESLVKHLASTPHS